MAVNKLQNINSIVSTIVLTALVLVIVFDFRYNTPSYWVNADLLTHNCHAGNSGIECTFTNTDEIDAITCLRGILSQKKANWVKIKSLPICTGKIKPQHTVTISSPWVGGFAKDICFSTNRLDMRVLDWEACNFIAEPIEKAKLRTISN